MELWQAVILGIVEGVTEYLPVSSTGHLIITAALLGIDDPETKRSMDAFMIVMQGGAIAAVAGLYWPRIVQMIRGFFGRDVEGRRLLINLILAFLPAACIGLLLESWIDANLFHAYPVVAALFIGGIYMMIVDRIARPRPARKSGAGIDAPGSDASAVPAPDKEKVPQGTWLRGTGEVTDVTPAKALTIGCFQVVAMWPGTSRSMMTITGGMITGLRPAAAAEFSFLLGLPTLGAATLYKLTKNLYESNRDGQPNLFQELGVMSAAVSMVVATLAAAVSVKWLVSFLNRHGLTPFGWYRIGVAIVMLVLIQAGIVAIGTSELIEGREEPLPAPVGMVDPAR